ncbi:interferon-induced protein 35 [Tachysurus fulvidraco]|uniref:interferon-induced protein 35 n=1 Tax=Tachysurus fulvidraco TaxID=1234273 RepID=UPI001FEEE393|nr:interferon-induced protein 35 [Tachysurus fulvidraco]XP_047656952.1 interferon-induced protein 35 [Tachysurus fulvidraco]XP_047656953.1 interferon-induced protein 35 [Tachysurus fulvidraco]
MMSSEEDFSLVSEDDPSFTLKSIQKDIEKLKEVHNDLVRDCKFLNEAKESNIKFTEQFCQRVDIAKRRLEDENMSQSKALKKEEERLSDLQKEEKKLNMECMKIQQELNTMHETHQSLKQQTEVSTAVPEKKVVFNGETAEEADALSFDVKPHIVYPMEGGTAFITFEEEDVAEKILALKEHVVHLGECSITVRAEPVQFLVPASVEMDTQVCPHRILISNLPKKEYMDRILDKLEIHFSKSRYGGGEVEEIDMLEDSGNVVIKFIDSTIAKGLTDNQMHEIELDKGKRHKVKVTPFLNGEITLLKTCNTTCNKTVLLTGIPDVMEKDNLQDLLEIHFQKSANSGGEVDAIVYNPVGGRTFAVFEEDKSKPEQDQ